MSIQKIIDRQAEYYSHDAGDRADLEYSPLLNLNLPKYKRYAICNLRGGIGKSTLSFNLTYDTDDVIAVDTCPQGNSTAFFTSGNIPSGTTVYDALLPYMLPRMPFPSNIAQKIVDTNLHFADKNSYFVPSSPNLYEFPSIMESALTQAKSIPGGSDKARSQILNSFRDLIDRETKNYNLSKVIVDTSPFFSGATHLAWHAVDSLIVPVRTDQQSVDSLKLLIQLLSDPVRSFLRSQEGLKLHKPKIQLVIVTHCGWSTRPGARNEPNNQTKVYLERIKEIVSNHIDLFTTKDPDNHIAPLDDFLGSGRIASVKHIPIKCLKSRQNFTIGGQRVEVNESVEKCQKQLSFITSNIW